MCIRDRLYTCTYVHITTIPVCRFLYEADVVIVMNEGRISCCGHPRKVLPQVEEQLQSTRDKGGEKPEGGAKGGSTNKADLGSTQVQVSL